MSESKTCCNFVIILIIVSIFFFIFLAVWIKNGTNTQEILFSKCRAKSSAPVYRSAEELEEQTSLMITQDRKTALKFVGFLTTDSNTYLPVEIETIVTVAKYNEGITIFLRSSCADIKLNIKSNANASYLMVNSLDIIIRQPDKGKMKRLKCRVPQSQLSGYLSYFSSGIDCWKPFEYKCFEIEDASIIIANLTIAALKLEFRLKTSERNDFIINDFIVGDLKTC